MRRVGVVFMLVAVPAMLLGSCSGSDDGSDSDAEPTAVLTGTAREFYDLLYGGLEATYRLTYQTTTPEGTPGGDYVIYSRPPLTRIDTVPAGTSEADSLIIGGAAADATIGCSGGPDAWECSEIDPLGDSLLRAAGPVAFLSANDIAAFTVTRATTGRSIAGKQATCYELVPVNGGTSGDSEYCLGADGAVLYASTPSQTVEAADYSVQVADEDFAPPVPPS